jgi:hypothetical protein
VGRETNKQRRERQADTAREKAAVARAAQRRTEQRRRALSILGTVVTVAVVGAVIAVVAINSGGSQSNDRVAASPSVVNTLTSVTPASLTTVAGGSTTPLAKPTKSTDPALTANGKPEVLYVGGEFCPFCAAERWSMVQALSRFGTFKGLSEIHSATDDGNVATFSFYQSTYASKYLAFTPVEDKDRNQNPLEPMTATQEKIFSEYTTGFPFIDFGGKYVQTAAGYAYNDLSGMTQAQIAAALKDPTSKIAQDILGEANNLTATICKITDNAPASVCTASQITSIQGHLGA